MHDLDRARRRGGHFLVAVHTESHAPSLRGRCDSYRPRSDPPQWRGIMVASGVTPRSAVEMEFEGRRGTSVGTSGAAHAARLARRQGLAGVALPHAPEAVPAAPPRRAPPRRDRVHPRHRPHPGDGRPGHRRADRPALLLPLAHHRPRGARRLLRVRAQPDALPRRVPTRVRPAHRPLPLDPDRRGP